MKTADQVAARELYLYAVNDAGLYHSHTQPIIANLAKKRRRGIYDQDKALILWGYLADDAAKRYNKEHGTGTRWFELFTVATRSETARELAAHYAEELAEDA